MGWDDEIRHPQNDRARMMMMRWWMMTSWPSVLVVPVCQWPGTRGPVMMSPRRPMCLHLDPQINTCTAALPPHKWCPSIPRCEASWAMARCQVMDNVPEPSSGWRLNKEASTGCIAWTLTRPLGFYLIFLANSKREVMFVSEDGSSCLMFECLWLVWDSPWTSASLCAL